MLTVVLFEFINFIVFRFFILFQHRHFMTAAPPNIHVSILQRVVEIVLFIIIKLALPNHTCWYEKYNK